MNHILLVEDCKEIYQMVHQSVQQIAELNWAKSLEEATHELATNTFSERLL